MAISTIRRPSVSIVGPALLWSAHFVFVYVFVSLACLWSWGEISFLWIGVIEWVVALATLAFGAAIAAIGWRAWREADLPPPSGPRSRQAFVSRFGVLSSALFLASTLLVGLPTLVRPACY